ncbi:MAG TPA: DUF4136 domain-containing protein [Draconibacterium sp.]|nr:DUF4136 domain-containing protein [Draconibacterium sp.]
MKQKFLPLVLIAMLSFLWGCYPDGAEYYEDTDVVYTNYEKMYDFKAAGTYSMPDKIVKITGNLTEGEEPEFVKEPYNTQVLTRIQENMTKMGYTYIDTQDATDVDLVLLPAVWTNTTVYYYYDYWCWYYPYYCGWGWGYPSVSSYTTGTLLMTLVSDDAEFVEPTNVWTSAANGLMSGYGDVTRVNKAIDQAFKQSPYLNTK